MSQLPIQGVIAPLIAAVRTHPQVILKAAPGAGKSTYFPLQLLKQQVVTGKIIMLEPRRLAARNIARYLANQLGENLGQQVGYRVRGENQTSAQTQLEIVTEGVLTRMLQTDPELNGVDLVIFDEYHQRSLHADTALAFCLEVQQALRSDLKLVVMSATLDHKALINLLPEAKYIESQGRSYPVEYRYVAPKPNQGLEALMAAQIAKLMANESGSLLAFLPGVAAIKRVEQGLQHLSSDIMVCPLYGQLDFAQQQAAIAPAAKGQRKVVLATNIAETSLTIEGIRLVIDCGYERVAKFDLKAGVTRLEQQRIAQSSAEQRAGRAGRTEAGICVRLYSQEQLALQPDVSEPEILHSDLSTLALELALWGAQSADELNWLDTPPESALKQAKNLLIQLDLFDAKGQLTAIGRQASQLGLEPRACAMFVKASSSQQTAAAVIALLEHPERNTLDFSHSVDRLIQGLHSQQKRVIERAKSLCKRLGENFSLVKIEQAMVPLLLTRAFPDRIAKARVKQQGRWLLSSGHGAQIEDTHKLASCDYLIALDLMRGAAESSHIFSAIALNIADLQDYAADLFTELEVVDWDEKKGRLVAQKQIKIGALIVESCDLPAPPSEKMAQALLNFVRRKGLGVLNWTPQSKDLLERIRCGKQWLPEKAWPEVDDISLLENLEQWLAPYLTGVNSVKALVQVDLQAALLAYLTWPLNQEIDQWLPTHYRLLTGSKKKIRYQQGQDPVLSVRMQEFFGQQGSPEIAEGRKRLVLELLSPAQRPLQVTCDLASFWQGAYKQVQKEMKGRYPKHVWPDDPANHVATTKTKRQLNL